MANNNKKLKNKKQKKHTPKPLTVKGAATFESKSVSVEEAIDSWDLPPNAIRCVCEFGNGAEVWGVKYLNDDGDVVWGSEEEEQEFLEACEEAQNL